MVLSSDHGRFAGLATSALLERRPELLVLPPAVMTDLDVRLKQDEPDVVLTVLQPGASGTAELSQILDALEHAPDTGIVVLSPGRRHDAQVLLTQRQRPSAYLAVANVQDDTFAVRAIEAVAQGLVAVNADWGTGASVVAGTEPDEPPSAAGFDPTRVGRLGMHCRRAGQRVDRGVVDDRHQSGRELRRQHLPQTGTQRRGRHPQAVARRIDLLERPVVRVQACAVIAAAMASANRATSDSVVSHEHIQRTSPVASFQV
jgi:hypothetical protein